MMNSATQPVTLLDPEGSLPAVTLKPAPWQLHASAYVLAVRMPEDVLDHDSFVPQELIGRRRGETAFVLYVDYQTANCGPYHELLVAPAVFDFGQGDHYPTITRIYVSTYDSVVNGRINWGIPKDRADFERRPGKDKIDEVRVSRDGHVFAELRLQSYGLSVPATSWLLPAGLRTVMQLWKGRAYRVTLTAKGSMRMARLLDWRFDPQLFPDLARGKVIAAAYFPSFEMTFPEAVVRDFG